MDETERTESAVQVCDLRCDGLVLPLRECAGVVDFVVWHRSGR